LREKIAAALNKRPPSDDVRRVDRENEYSKQ